MTTSPSLDVGLYTPDLAARLTNVSKSTLSNWSGSGLIRPSIETDLSRASRLYTHADLGAIILVRELRGFGLSMQRLRRAAAWFESQSREGEPWTNRRVWTDGADLFTFADDGSTPVAASRSGQAGIAAFLPDVIDGLFANRLHNIPAVQEYIAIDPEVECGLPVVKGTRLTTRFVANVAGPQSDVQRVHDLYPQLSQAAIQAAIQFEQELGRLAA